MQKYLFIIIFLIIANKHALADAMEHTCPQSTQQINSLYYFFNGLKNRADYVFENPFPNTPLSVKEGKTFGIKLPFSILQNFPRTDSWRVDLIANVKSENLKEQLKIGLLYSEFIQDSDNISLDGVKGTSTFVFLAIQKGLAFATFKNKINGQEETKKILIEVVE